MFDATAEIVRVFEAAGIGPWVADGFGRNVRLDEFAAEFVAQLSEAVSGEAHEEATRLGELRELLDEKPRKSLAVSKIREVIDAA